MKVKILHAEVEFLERPFIKSLRLSTGIIEENTEARVKEVPYTEPDMPLRFFPR
jgi:hypothetical protein